MGVLLHSVSIYCLQPGNEMKAKETIVLVVGMTLSVDKTHVTNISTAELV